MYKFTTKGSPTSVQLLAFPCDLNSMIIYNGKVYYYVRWIYKNTHIYFHLAQNQKKPLFEVIQFLVI